MLSYKKEFYMKKIIFAFLLVASLLVTSSVTYASYTSDFVTYDEIQNSYQVDVLFQGNRVFDFSDVNYEGNNFNADIREFDYYQADVEYTLHIKVDGVVQQSILNAYRFWAYNEGQDDGYIEVYDITGNELYGENFSNLNNSFYWTYIESDSSPVLDGDTAFITTIDDPISVSTIESYITAYDETDGSLSHAIEFVDSARDFLTYIVAKGLNDGELSNTTVQAELDDYDNNTLNVSLMGQTLDKATVDLMYSTAYVDLVYSELVTDLEPLDGAQDFYVLDYYVSDTAGNYTTLEVQVYVKDVLAPVGINDDVTINYNVTYDLSSYLSSVVPSLFVDNYNNTSEITFTIQSDNYTANKTIPGNYDVQFKAVDASGNIGYAILTIHVEDQVNPVFSGPSSITKKTSETLTLSEIKSQLSANDAIDGNLTTSIQVVSDDFTGKGNLVGSYDIQFSVTDVAGNTAYHTVTINAVDNIPPVFFVADGYFISVEQTISLDLQDFIDILEATGQIQVDGSGGVTVVSAYNEYFGNETTPGIYALTLTGASVSGDEYIWNLAVEVVETNSDDSVDVEDLPIYQEFWNDHQNEVITAAIILISIVGIVGLGAIAFKSVKKTNKKSKKRK
jgi:hypothetical protein